MNTNHSGTTVSGEEYEIMVTHGHTFRAYDTNLLAEVAVEDGVISYTRIPEELDAMQARALAAMFMDAADQLERWKQDQAMCALAEDSQKYRNAMQSGAKLNGEVKAGEDRPYRSEYREQENQKYVDKIAKIFRKGKRK